MQVEWVRWAVGAGLELKTTYKGSVPYSRSPMSVAAAPNCFRPRVMVECTRTEKLQKWNRFRAFVNKTIWEGFLCGRKQLN